MGQEGRFFLCLGILQRLVVALVVETHLCQITIEGAQHIVLAPEMTGALHHLDGFLAAFEAFLLITLVVSALAVHEQRHSHIDNVVTALGKVIEFVGIAGKVFFIELDVVGFYQAGKHYHLQRVVSLNGI